MGIKPDRLGIGGCYMMNRMENQGHLGCHAACLLILGQHYWKQELPSRLFVADPTTS